MAEIDLKSRVVKFIRSLPVKHQRQVKKHILQVADNHMPHDSKKLVGYAGYYRTDCGEYRIIYRPDPACTLVTVVLVGKRNDSEVYRIAKRVLK